MLKYAELLKPTKEDVILVAGSNPLPAALYLAGAGGCRAHAVVPASAPALSETQALEYVRKNRPELAPVVEKGLSLVAFSITSLVEKPPAFTKAVLAEDKTENLMKELELLAAAGTAEKTVLIDLPFSFFRPFTTTTRRLFSKPRLMSFRKILEESGAPPSFYDAADKRLYAVASLAKFSQVFSSLAPLDDSDFAQLLKAELGPYAERAAPGSSFAAKVLEEEYLAFTTVSEAADAHTDYAFVFLDGKKSVAEARIEEYAKRFVVILVPNTPAFVKELEAKEIIIVQKERIPNMFGERR